MKKICFCASSGGHLEQLMMLEELMQEHQSYLLTEKTSYSIGSTAKKGLIRAYFFPQINRFQPLWRTKLVLIALRSLVLALGIHPDVVICTGVLAMIPFCLWAKLLGAKLIYIESFAKVTSPTLTGRLLCRLADRFYVQWESMLAVYPGAVYAGSLY